jgi:hypothetical protein
LIGLGHFPPMLLDKRRTVSQRFPRFLTRTLAAARNIMV